MPCGQRGKFALEAYRFALLLTQPAHPLVADSRSDFVWGAAIPTAAVSVRTCSGSR